MEPGRKTPSDAVDPESHGARLLRLQEVADRLSVSRSFAWKLVAQGDLRSIRIGRAVRIRPRDLDAYIADPQRQR